MNGWTRAGTQRIFAFRRVVAVLLIAVYVLSSALHGVLDPDAGNPVGSHAQELSSSHGATIADGENAPDADRGIAVSHHCHGCFSGLASAPAEGVVVSLEPKNVKILRSIAWFPYSVRGLDPPPPKSLS